MRILPRAQRDAMFEIYSFCRAVDDIADEGGSRSARNEALRIWRDDIASLYHGGNRSKHLRDLAEAIARFDLAEQDFHAIIDGMAMDVAGDIRAPDLETLDLYCDRVASAVGRLSVRVFGVPDPLGPGLAHHLGRALQLTNILRDLDEDAELGRLYLPREALEAAGIQSTTPKEVVEDKNLGDACAPVIERAKNHFAEAWAIMAKAPRNSIRAPAIMGSVYGMILQKLSARGFMAPRVKIRLPRYRVLFALLRYGLI